MSEFCPVCGYSDVDSIEYPDGRCDSRCDCCGWARHVPSAEDVEKAREQLGTKAAFRLGPTVILFCSKGTLLDVASNLELSAVLCDIDGDTHRYGLSRVPCSIEHTVTRPPWGEMFIQIVDELKGTDDGKD